jgi:hypothetical protein
MTIQASRDDFGPHQEAAMMAYVKEMILRKEL